MMLLSSSDQKRCVDYLQFGCHSTAPVQSLLCPLVGDSSLICFISRNAESFENGSRYLCLFVGLVPGYDHLMESLLVVVFLCACVWPFVLNSSCGFLSTFSYCVFSSSVGRVHLCNETNDQETICVLCGRRLLCNSCSL